MLAVSAPSAAILLVDDYPSGLLVGTFMLEHLGYTVEAAICGQQAINKVRDAEEPFLAILMDVKMYDMTGFEATKAIRLLERAKNWYHPILAITAHALAGDRERCLEAGMDDYLSKPLHPELLAQKLAGLAKSYLPLTPPIALPATRLRVR
jgi:two-component system, sensor histidine kinase